MMNMRLTSSTLKRRIDELDTIYTVVKLEYLDPLAADNETTATDVAIKEDYETSVLTAAIEGLKTEIDCVTAFSPDPLEIAANVMATANETTETDLFIKEVYETDGLSAAIEGFKMEIDCVTNRLGPYGSS